MASKSVSVRMSMKDLAYMLFKKKICEKCGARLTKETCSKVVNGSNHFTKPRDATYLKRDEVVVSFYKFTCPTCGHSFTIGDIGDIPTHLQ